MIKYVWYFSSVIFGALVLNYLNEYCAESLVKFEFFSVVKDELKPLTKKFTKVQRVVFLKSYTVESGWIKRTFPNVQYIECYSNYEMAIHNIGCLVDHFPHLERFKYTYHGKFLLESTKEHMAATVEKTTSASNWH